MEGEKAFCHIPAAVPEAIETTPLAAMSAVGTFPLSGHTAAAAGGIVQDGLPTGAAAVAGGLRIRRR
ncbi:MAG TPA: hypothetical protein PLO14_11345 [Accumulibacter sp.]|uniref:hypothetical protein n=1 Tax=Accumulibacter sp. TaxID=2053492 RepID=UPI0025EBC79E|nr:hypothetical protein [Accumulibacter sp.]MCM8597265.1 hypothetical protein [Accumulibacter sp.]MCM8661493.1 hypothetical protein [Accumulibacter sp.]HNC52817.1 hypothetical protein [Accumulibacter sp.]